MTVSRMTGCVNDHMLLCIRLTSLATRKCDQRLAGIANRLFPPQV